MRVLVTGGTGVVGRPAVRSLLARGHTVRLFSRQAARDAASFPTEGIEAHPGSVDSAEAVGGAMRGVDAVLHIAGIVEETPPEVTFDKVNVQGTRNLVAAASRAGVPRFVYVSSLGADRGQSAYHRSKRAAEEIVRGFEGEWIVLRPGNVYGPGDEVISLLLKMVRTLPAIPTVDEGDQPFQPVWADDLGEAIAMSIERDDLAGRTLALAGTERVSTNQVLDHFERLTDQHPPRLGIPAWLAATGAKIASAFGIDAPVNADQITMLTEGNLIPPGEPNALVEVFGIAPTPLEEGLRRLCDELPEQLPEEGVGSLVRRRYWAEIARSRLDADALWGRFIDRFSEIAPEGMVQVGAEPGTPTRIEEGATLTLGLPMRGHVQVRVAEVADRSATFVTVSGHPLAGTVRFDVEPHGALLRFQVTTYDRPSNVVDYLAIQTVGRALKHSTWRTVVERVVEESGGEAPDGVEQESTTLDDEATERAEQWAEGLVRRLQREEMERELER